MLGTIKYTHVHIYDMSNHEAKLLWKASIHREYKWAYEVSQIVYDTVGNRLLLADGYKKLENKCST